MLGNHLRLLFDLFDSIIIGWGSLKSVFICHYTQTHSLSAPLPSFSPLFPMLEMDFGSNESKFSSRRTSQIIEANARTGCASTLICKLYQEPTEANTITKTCTVLSPFIIFSINTFLNIDG